MTRTRTAPPAGQGKRGQAERNVVSIPLPLPGLAVKAPLPVVRRLVERYASKVMDGARPWRWCWPLSLLVDAEAMALDKAMDEESPGRLLQ